LGPERGDNKTKPVDEIQWLYEKKGQDRAIMVSTSFPIPSKGSEEDNDQPPHRQAAAYYEDVKAKLNGQFVVTMEHPTKSKPEPLVIEIDKNKGTLKKSTLIGGAGAISQSSPRAG
jgi:hypothetical protein